MSTLQLDDLIRDTLDGHDDRASLARGRALAVARLDQAAAPNRRRTRMPRRVILVAAVIVSFLVAGVALAATTDFAQRILGSREPAVDRIGVLKEAGGKGMTDDEIGFLFRGADLDRRIGQRIAGDRGHVIVGDDRARLTAIRTSTGEVCMHVSAFSEWSRPGGPYWHPDGASCGAFMDGWPIMDGWIEHSTPGKPADVLMFGLVADGVRQVRFLAGDRSFDATMGQNGFIWHQPEGIRAESIDAVLDDGTIVRREYPRPGAHQPPSAPHVVGNVDHDMSADELAEINSSMALKSLGIGHGVVGPPTRDERGAVRVGILRQRGDRVTITLSFSTAFHTRWRFVTALLGYDRFEPSWPIFAASERGPTPHGGHVEFGVAARGVRAVRFHADGRTHEAKVVRGTFIWWPHGSPDITAIDVVLKDGTVVRRSTDAGAKPHVVS